MNPASDYNWVLYHEEMTQKKFGGTGGLKGLLDETKQTAKHNLNFPKIIRKITLKSLRNYGSS